MLDEWGVFKFLYNLGIIVEDLNLLFFLKKINGEFCLVIVFISVGRYLKKI